MSLYKQPLSQMFRPFLATTGKPATRPLVTTKVWYSSTCSLNRGNALSEKQQRPTVISSDNEEISTVGEHIRV
ncbi:HHL168Wp [Eremothecium sinecaudum]|uniref:HHL168Wp n=1 Tax=Eremothecium sinecaudum TaxID=45286 RepID=A0A0X8HW77_9SACH|nr:HHL168Wp [Eremothecium sinecaudum]AMD22602.1 HHL168Wp [Eremothecium sinecaudum]